MRYLSLLLISLALAACTSVNDTRTFDSFDIKDASTYFVSEQAPSAPAFNLAVRTALAGNDRELAYLLSLIQYTDAATAPAYGQYLTDLKKFIGGYRFNSVLSRIAKDQQASIQNALTAAAKSPRP